jgi:hypothetical protein
VVKIEPPGIGDPARTFSRMLGADLPFNPDLRERQSQQAQHRARSVEARGARDRARADRRTPMYS